MNPDIVYLYNDKCSLWRGREIIFSIRSLEKHGENYGRVIIVGSKPTLLNDKIIHISQEDIGPFKEKKIYEKLLTACRSEIVSDPFVFFNDDFFLVKKIDFTKLRFYYSDNIRNKILHRRKEDTYKRALKNTRDALFLREYPEKYFDIHYPMYYHKNKFIRVMQKYDWDVRAGYVIKSLYANSLRISGKPKKDFKIYIEHNKSRIREIISQTDLFSTDNITRAMAELLNELYPGKSSYEL